MADDRALLSQPWVGASWEGFVIDQILGELGALGRSFDAWYFRTSDGYGRDVVLDVGGELWAVDVKLTGSPGAGDLDRLDRAADLIGATRRFLVSQTSRPAGNERRASENLGSFLERLRRDP